MEFFRIEELVDKFTFEKLGANSIWMLNSNAVANLIKLRKAIGKPITVNNYHLGGNLSNRGYRSIYSTTGANLANTESVMVLILMSKEWKFQKSMNLSLQTMLHLE